MHICTPPHAHHLQALTCLRAGVSVLVEKPPVISLREFDELTSAEPAAGAGPAAASPGPWFSSVYQHRFGAAPHRLKAAGAGRERIVPSGKLPVQMPATPAASPSSYLRSRLTRRL